MFNDDDLFGFGGMHRFIHHSTGLATSDSYLFRSLQNSLDGEKMAGQSTVGNYVAKFLGPPPPPHHRQVARPFDPFRGFGGLFSEDLQERAMNDPNSHVYSQSTMVTFGGDGQPRVVENSVRKSGDVKETRRALRDGAREEMSIGHTIGDRTHIIEKKRDKDGNVRRQQRFVNLDEGSHFKVITAQARDDRFKEKMHTHSLPKWIEDSGPCTRTTPYMRLGQAYTNPLTDVDL
ncbi:hypothetical protein COOONC_19848 [Cooperia oncophora]